MASKRGTPLRNRYFTTTGSSGVKTVADRLRRAAYHSKHCRQAFQWYQHPQPSTASAFEVITETRYINYLLTYNIDDLERP